MTNPNKVKGSTFERLIVELMSKLVKRSTWKRIPGSGAIGTSLQEPLLTADVVGKMEALAKPIKAECKVGYGGATQLTLRKEWLDKVKMEADATFGIPVLFGKFSGARGGVQVFAVMDIETFASMLNHITNLQEELDAKANNTGSDAGVE